MKLTLRKKAESECESRYILNSVHLVYEKSWIEVLKSRQLPELDPEINDLFYVS